MTLRRIALPFGCICLLTLAACGFHPRAELALPPDLGPVKVVTSDPYSPLGDSLSRVLTRAGAQPAAQGCVDAAGALPVPDPNPGCAGTAATLHVVSETWSEVPLSVDAFSHVREYIITYTVKFSFVAADNTDISALQEARLQRDFTYDDAHALGAAQERDTIHEEMQRDMAATIIRRIGIALRHYKSGLRESK
jgi:LPS-assembly lipoprotein